ncbi:nuclear transport factor 2 family protein [Pseudomonas sp. N040]|uniref:nuclear transport factor 2 family protein n=1 Tax=Pseudomonas sp. N040 TaxID=2785325 RepID=UPI0018A25BE6|nr:nuclear transport factor 2 family protein [Pseudomonas sp. N040]MBF7730472.1 nuclear transport factor 2 family protein [Pseudomonas sp. N040]MBW7014115.1 nuclear transport factor 2 family protein [Pseudomonas sp. N040]
MHPHQQPAARRIAIRHGLALVFAYAMALASPAVSAASAVQDQLAIAANVANFARRDQGDWAGLRNLFGADGQIAVTWYRGSIDGFIAASQKMAEDAGTQSKHWIGTPRIRLCGERAVSETDVAIMARSQVASVEVDVTSYASFLDTFARDSDGQWRVVQRTAIYEKDRIDPVAPSLLFSLIYPFAGFDDYPPAYRHLAAGLERKGFQLAEPIIVAHSPAEAELKAGAAQWAGC